jgi:16S rRNA (cytosine967-C5)-methyltransferase
MDPWLERAPPPPVRHVLRLGAAGLLLLGTPSHAAVATAVGLARRRRLASFAGLVNAVLRRLSEAGPSLLDGLDGPRLDTPSWLWAAWGSQARAIAEAHQVEAPLDISLRQGETAPPGGEALPSGSWRFPPGTRVAELDGFDEGAFWVQDAAAALPARLLEAQPGERVADLCAAPGGKTAQLASAGAEVWAIERDPERLQRLGQNLRRLRLTAQIVESDATTWRPSAPVDAILLDAPCSATGTIRRHPDVAHLKRARDVAAMTVQQDRLLEAACAMLRSGGRLVYAVCSLQPEEGPQRVVAALECLPLRLRAVAAAELPGLDEALTPEGTVRTLPSMWSARGGIDGFFVAKFVRT